jgi:hypothetical protein
MNICYVAIISQFFYIVCHKQGPKKYVDFGIKCNMSFGVYADDTNRSKLGMKAYGGEKV